MICYLRVEFVIRHLNAVTLLEPRIDRFWFKCIHSISPPGRSSKKMPTTSSLASKSFALTRVAYVVNIAFTFATIFCLGRLSALKHDLFVGCVAIERGAMRVFIGLVVVAVDLS